MFQSQFSREFANFARKCGEADIEERNSNSEKRNSKIGKRVGKQDAVIVPRSLHSGRDDRGRRGISHFADSVRNDGCVPKRGRGETAGMTVWVGRGHLVDQLGDSLWPEKVSSWGWEPSASMVQIWRGPERVDSKTRWRPSGAQEGRSLRPLSRVISMMWREETSMM